jgi:predicted nucleic acid-binding Zn ribbon protein
VSTWQPSTPAPGARDPRKLSEILDRVTRRLGGPSSGTTSTVFTGWEALVGPDIAGHARPLSLHDGVLVLAVDQPAWATQLRYMTAELLTRIADATAGAEVTEIQLRVVGQPTPESPFRRGRKRRL